ncbi:MAG: primosomal protein N' [Gammaproteobacteria bacterium]|nr:primosomal protein N' [Gammaproteobacteria bacterium]
MTRPVVQVAVPRPLRRIFDYSLPAQLPQPSIGARVRVPFGRSEVLGIVTGFRQMSSHRLKPLIDILDEDALLARDLIALAEWLSSYYHHPLGEVYATLLPSAAKRGALPKPRWPLAWTAATDDGGRLARAPRQRQAFETLQGLGATVPERELRTAGIDRRTLAALADKGLAQSSETKPTYRVERSPISLNPEQRAAVNTIHASIGTHATHVLDGVTGSGKTEVYMRVIAKVLDTGGQVMVLVPEIGLTPQAMAHFRRRFGGAAALHSAETDNARLNIWAQCKSGDHRILVGTRSAVFTPFADLRLIIVDEEHDTSFKQQEGLRYSARDVALKRAQLLEIPTVLGSATPSLETLANIARGRYRRNVLKSRAGGASMPQFRVIDIRGRRLRDGLSDTLLHAIRRHLDAGNQVLVFINRRGFAPTCLCSACGWQARCADCDARLTLHESPRALHCHHCDRRYRYPDACPDCGADTLVHLGTGTQRIDAALREHFPELPLYRIDRDTAQGPTRFAAQLDTIRREGAAILVGTQMLAKGHHLPAVTLVAVVDADNGFLSSDFRAPERTAQNIVQVAGRAGRAERPGEVWIQSYDPDNPNLKALIQRGYAGFAAIQAADRRSARLPPYAAMAMLRAESTNAHAAVELLRLASDIIRRAWDNHGRRTSGDRPGRPVQSRSEAPIEPGSGSWKSAATAGDTHPEFELMGPVPAPIPRLRNRFRYQCMICSRRRGPLHAALSALEAAELVVPKVRWSIDVDPLDTF